MDAIIVHELEHDEDWHAALPRDDAMDGSGLRIVRASEIEVSEPEELAITDGERTAVYRPYSVLKDGAPEGRPEIIDGYTEAGWFCDANCVTIRDGRRESIYAPVRILTSAAAGTAA
jgi:hypothetical protein